eukprot:1035545-Amphidinium_carterae.1
MDEPLGAPKGQAEALATMPKDKSCITNRYVRSFIDRDCTNPAFDKHRLSPRIPNLLKKY